MIYVPRDSWCSNSIHLDAIVSPTLDILSRNLGGTVTFIRKILLEWFVRMNELKKSGSSPRGRQATGPLAVNITQSFAYPRLEVDIQKNLHLSGSVRNHYKLWQTSLTSVQAHIFSTDVGILAKLLWSVTE